MSEGKEGFVLYKGFWAPIEALDNDALGRLFRALYEYQLHGTIETDPDIKMAFMFFLNQFKVDEKKYQKIVERNRGNGKKGGRPKKNPDEPKKPNGLFGNPENPKNPSEPKKADKDKDKDKDKEKGNKSTGRKRQFIPPSFQEVKEYATTRNRSDLVKSFFDYYHEGDWQDKEGKPVKNWKQKFISWENYSPKAEAQQKNKNQLDLTGKW